MKIFLLGFMGAGKSTFGKRLANALQYDFIDLDTEIAHQAGMSASAFISLKGENAFRELESTCLKSLKSPGNAVVATGGGTPCFFDNMDWMNKEGITIYINVPEGVLHQRLSMDAGARPLLENKQGEELKLHIEYVN